MQVNGAFHGIEKTRPRCTRHSGAAHASAAELVAAMVVPMVTDLEESRYLHIGTGSPPPPKQTP
ncbi:unnamed protein product [Arctogadus glacialis]